MTQHFNGVESSYIYIYIRSTPSTVRRAYVIGDSPVYCGVRFSEFSGLRQSGKRSSLISLSLSLLYHRYVYIYIEGVKEMAASLGMDRTREFHPPSLSLSLCLCLYGSLNPGLLYTTTAGFRFSFCSLCLCTDATAGVDICYYERERGRLTPELLRNFRFF